MLNVRENRTGNQRDMDSPETQVTLRTRHRTKTKETNRQTQNRKLNRSKAWTPSKPVEEPRYLRIANSSRYKTPAVLLIVKCGHVLSVIEVRKHLQKKQKIHRYLRN